MLTKDLLFQNNSRIKWYLLFLKLCRHIRRKPTTVWPENLTGIKFDEIASKLHNKNMTDFNLTKCAVRHIVSGKFEGKLTLTDINLTVSAKNVKPSY